MEHKPDGKREAISVPMREGTQSDGKREEVSVPIRDGTQVKWEERRGLSAHP
ncbi:hypothetical protein M3175_00660 [Robertmurraya korlensis]|uniref:hypothetical protein n=1 Tax=Robertmurraya korlensis TaxID=519977 RepID=UPI00203E951A|nr:hypothetical protein [Robertmurraya korlensis]MCM3599224.1 hypothetical protein [Robertmurraya korlensis]